MSYKEGDIMPHNNRDEKHGYWQLMWDDDNIMNEGLYMNDEQVGLWWYNNTKGVTKVKKYYII